jgi:hypothetical protein
MKEGSRASFEQERIQDSSFIKQKMFCPECVVALCPAGSRVSSGRPESLGLFVRVSGSPRYGVEGWSGGTIKKRRSHRQKSVNFTRLFE